MHSSGVHFVWLPPCGLIFRSHINQKRSKPARAFIDLSPIGVACCRSDLQKKDLNAVEGMAFFFFGGFCRESCFVFCWFGFSFPFSLFAFPLSGWFGFVGWLLFLGFAWFVSVLFGSCRFCLLCFSLSCCCFWFGGFSACWFCCGCPSRCLFCFWLCLGRFRSRCPLSFSVWGLSLSPFF